MHLGQRNTLEQGSRKYHCPDCGKKTFVRYVDTHTAKYLPEQYGRCDREIKCGLHNPPPQPELQEIKCLAVPFNKLTEYSSKAFKLERGSKHFFIPKTMVFEIVERGCYVSEWYLTNTQRPPTFINDDCRFYLKGKRIDPPKSLVNRCQISKNVPREPAFIPKSVFQQTLQHYEQNVFLQNLLSRVPFPIDVKDVEMVTALYYLGTVCNGYRAGAITFPFIDRAGNIRAIQAKEFDEMNHTAGTDFIHSIIAKHHQKRNEPLPEWLEAYNQNEAKVSCLFGEHLLSKYLMNPVALVEAPKTAVYGCLYFGFPELPENLLWLAVYNLSSLNLAKCKSLQGRDVYLFPDLSKDGKAFNLWSRRAKELSEGLTGTRFEISDLLERLAQPDLRNSGADLADVLIQLDWKQFRIETPQQLEPVNTEGEKSENGEAGKKTSFHAPQPEQFPTIQPSAASQNFTNPHIENLIKPEIESWEHDVTELETFFASTIFPVQSVQLNQCSTITNLSLFLQTHFATVKANNGKRTFLPYLKRLKELKEQYNIYIN